MSSSLDDTDRAIIELLQADGRMPFTKVAAEVGLTEGAIRQRVQRLTDQGVMYKELHAFDKATANFEKAQKQIPKHLQSLFNLGIVYLHDLNAPAKARKAFEGVIALDPASKQAQDAKLALESLKTKGPSK